MPLHGLFEERLTAVERAVADLQRQIGQTASAPNWIDRFTGAFKDDKAFEEAVEFGRAIREADRPTLSDEP